jgi:hypothetical protein
MNTNVSSDILIWFFLWIIFNLYIVCIGDAKKEVGLDRAHPEETTIQHHPSSTHLEPAGEEKERSAPKHLAARHRRRYEKTGIQLG